VELAAELHKTTRELVAFGFEKIDPEHDIQLTIIEAGPRILPALPERVALAAQDLLKSLHVDVLTGELVTEVRAESVRTASGLVIPAELTVWAAGIKAPDFLTGLDGLEINRVNQLLVHQTLQTTRDSDIFAIGDCACCPWPGHAPCVPARAQAAHQEATHLFRNLRRRLEGRPLQTYVYRDFGSLVSLGEYSTVGSLMGKLMGGALFVEGFFARLMYIALYRMHLYALHGAAKVIFDLLGRLFTRRTEPRVKLH
jgi:NADH dehydrogenase